MEFEYISFLCHNLLGLNKNFSLHYNEYCKNHYIKNAKEFSFNEKLVKFMVEILRAGNDYDFLGDERLSDLYEYINEIRVLQDVKKVLVNDKDKHITEEKEKEKFSNYCFADSFLLRVELNDEKKEGKFFFYNVTCCDAIKETVDSVNIIVTFIEIIDLKCQGYFDFEFLKGATGYANKFEKISEGLYKFSLLCIVNYEHFIIEITFSEFTIENFEYDWNRHNNWLK